MSGTLAGTDGWFGGNASQVSAHTGVGLHGERHRYVKFTDRAWANGILQPGNKWSSISRSSQPNDWTLSIETEDLGVAATPVSNLQYEAVLQECHEMLRAYPSVKWLITHRSISPIDRPHCPGDRWLASGRFQALANALALVTVA